MLPTGICSPGLSTLASAAIVAATSSVDAQPEAPILVSSLSSVPTGDMVVCVPSVRTVSATAAAPRAEAAERQLVPVVGKGSDVVECEVVVSTFVHEVGIRYPRVMRPLNANTVVCIPFEAANSGLHTHYTFFRGKTATDSLWSDSLFFKCLADHCASTLKHANAVTALGSGRANSYVSLW
jgi:hypothetical protein